MAVEWMMAGLVSLLDRGLITAAMAVKCSSGTMYTRLPRSYTCSDQSAKQTRLSPLPCPLIGWDPHAPFAAHPSSGVLSPANPAHHTRRCSALAMSKTLACSPAPLTP